MPSTVWKGSLGFGLVNIPVVLHTATADRSIRFHQLERGTADRVRNKRVNERTGDEVDYAEIVKGYDLGGGEYVVLSPEELEAAAPERSHAIEIVAFVDLADIDPIFYRTTYYVAPDGEPARRAYALLRRALHDAGKVAVATLVLRNKEYLVTVRARSDVLALETMYFDDEVRSPDEEAGSPSGSSPGEEEFTERERATAQLLIDSMTRPWAPEEYHDTYRSRVEEIVARKRQGETVVSEPVAEAITPVIDLVQALEASVDRARTREASGKPARRATTKTNRGTKTKKKASRAPAAARRRAS